MMPFKAMRIRRASTPGSGGPVYLESVAYTRSTTNNATATCVITFGSNGILSMGAGVVGGSDYTWLLSGAASNYDIIYDSTAGVGLSVGVKDTWQNLGTSRSYGVTSNGQGERTTFGVIRIRNASTLAILASANVSLTATSEP